MSGTAMNSGAEKRSNPGDRSNPGEAAESPTPQAIDLDGLRRAIDDVDRRLLDLVTERVRLVLAVGEYKRQHGLAVYDPERERRVLDRLSQAASPPLDADTVRRVFERLIDESRRLEQHHVQRG
ncbi:MAG TPA: chorismate mutase [Polyangiaceae bacterium]|nr:chorismate mutase [Polyangiaceae bacterium]